MNVRQFIDRPNLFDQTDDDVLEKFLLLVYKKQANKKFKPWAKFEVGCELNVTCDRRCIVVRNSRLDFFSNKDVVSLIEINCSRKICFQKVVKL